MKITELQLRQIIKERLKTTSIRGDKIAQAIAILSIMDTPENPYKDQVVELGLLLQDMLEDAESKSWF